MNPSNRRQTIISHDSTGGRRRRGLFYEEGENNGKHRRGLLYDDSEADNVDGSIFISNPVKR